MTVISISVVFKVMGLVEITKGVRVHRKSV